MNQIFSTATAVAAAKETVVKAIGTDATVRNAKAGKAIKDMARAADAEATR